MYNLKMNKIDFEWDDKKSKTNIKKHGISFEAATTVFYDEQAIEFYYDLSKMKSRPNPYAKHLKREITINTDISVIEYFKEMALFKKSAHSESACLHPNKTQIKSSIRG